MSEFCVDWDAERAAFEHWYLTTQSRKNHGRMVKDVGTNIYIDIVVRIAWRSWQMGAKRIFYRLNLERLTCSMPW